LRIQSRAAAMRAARRGLVVCGTRWAAENGAAIEWSLSMYHAGSLLAGGMQPLALVENGRDHSRLFASASGGKARHGFWGAREPPWLNGRRRGWLVLHSVVPTHVSVCDGCAAWWRMSTEVIIRPGSGRGGRPVRSAAARGIVCRRWMMVFGFLVALQQCGDLFVFFFEPASGEMNSPFQPFDIAMFGGMNGRVRSRLFGLFAPLISYFHSANVRVRSRLVATIRDCSHLMM